MARVLLGRARLGKPRRRLQAEPEPRGFPLPVCLLPTGSLGGPARSGQDGLRHVWGRPRAEQKHRKQLCPFSCLSFDLPWCIYLLFFVTFS